MSYDAYSPLHNSLLFLSELQRNCETRCSIDIVSIYMNKEENEAYWKMIFSIFF